MDVVVGPIGLSGQLVVPDGARGTVLFAHGSGSSRFSPRNNHVAAALRAAGFATLLFDLLTDAEAADTANIFDVGLLAERLLQATAWIDGDAEAGGLPLGYFGASTGAAAALIAAAQRPARLRAVVSRGGRPDMAGPALAHVEAPTLLIVGGDDTQVLRLNREAMDRMRCATRLAIVDGATHLFEEPGCLDQVITLAVDWFDTHLGATTETSDAR